jgi:hypothetical protein
MREGNCVAVGWPNIGDLFGLSDGLDGKKKIRKKVEEDGDAPNFASQHTNEISAFVTGIADDDVILAANGDEIYPAHTMIRNLLGSMTRKLSVTSSQ